jgi:glutamyl-tRNA synthetase
MTAPRVRFAPSPTGDLHVGGVRSALFNWLYARRHGGTFILRVEDTDRERSTEESTALILEGMAWLGMNTDEGPFFQSQRYDRHRERIAELLENGHAYRCWCTKEELDAKRKEAERTKSKYGYDGTCRGRTEGPSPDAPFVVRAKLPHDGEVVVDDMVKGRVVTRNDQFDDFILARQDGSPVYNLSVVVDDIDMGITHVVRGDDHLSNTPKQIHLFRLFGAPEPRFGHLPMVHGTDGKKLSKRHGASSILAFREMGYLPETMLSFLVRLGWSHGDQEEFTLDELKTLFDLDGINPAAAVFDHQKLEWMNGRRLREMATADLLEAVRPFIEKENLDADAEWVPRALEALQPRANTLVALAEGLHLFADRGPVTYDEKAATKFLKPEGCALLGELADHLAAVEPFTSAALEEATRAFLESRELKMKHIGQPTRVALVGGTVSPSLFDVMEIFGRDTTLERMRAAAAWTA